MRPLYLCVCVLGLGTRWGARVAFIFFYSAGDISTVLADGSFLCGGVFEIGLTGLWPPNNILSFLCSLLPSRREQRHVS